MNQIRMSGDEPLESEPLTLEWLDNRIKEMQEESLKPHPKPAASPSTARALESLELDEPAPTHREEE